MSAFDGTTKLRRTIADPLTDHKLPHPQSLSWTTIHTPSAVAGTTGAHCEVVHGDRSYRLHGTHTEHITADEKCTVGGNQHIRVVGNHKETIVGNCNQSIIGPHLVANHNVRNETRLGAYTKVHGDFEVMDDHDGHFVYSSFLMSRCYVFDFEFFTSKIEIDLLMAQAMVAALTFGVTQASVSVFQNSWDGYKMTTKFLLQEIKNVTSDILAFASRIGAAAVHLLPKVNGGPSIGTGTPFR